MNSKLNLRLKLFNGFIILSTLSIIFDHILDWSTNSSLLTLLKIVWIIGILIIAFVAIFQVPKISIDESGISRIRVFDKVKISFDHIESIVRSNDKNPWYSFINTYTITSVNNRRIDIPLNVYKNESELIAAIEERVDGMQNIVISEINYSS